MEEIYFKRNWRTVWLAIAVVLGFELVSLPVEVKLLQKEDYFGIFLIQIIAIILLVGLIYPLVIQRQIIFYDEGINFVENFQRKFISWQKIEQVSNISRNQHPIFLLKSSKLKLKIRISEYSEKEKVISFLQSKLSQKM